MLQGLLRLSHSWPVLTTIRISPERGHSMKMACPFWTHMTSRWGPPKTCTMRTEPNGSIRTTWGRGGNYSLTSVIIYDTLVPDVSQGGNSDFGPTGYYVGELRETWRTMLSMRPIGFWFQVSRVGATS